MMGLLTPLMMSYFPVVICYLLSVICYLLSVICYLRGHISLAAASCEDEGITELAELKTRFETSLDHARSELEPADRVIVQQLWERLLSQMDFAKAP
jgi:hypothetical protein